MLSYARTDLLGDVRGSLRSILRRPAFSAALIGTLALGIGACVAIFAVLDAAVLRPAPYPNAERIASALALHPSSGPEPTSLWPADFLALRAANRSFSTFGAYVPFGTLDLTRESDPVRLPRFLVSEGALESLTLRPEAVRLFVPADYRSGGPRHRFARRAERHLHPDHHSVEAADQYLRSDHPFAGWAEWC